VDILLKSFVAWGAAALILTVAKFAGPRMAGAIAGIPIVFAVSYILVTYSNKSTSRNFLIGGLYGTAGFVVFVVSLVLLNQRFPANYWLNFTLAYLICLAVAVLLTHFSSSRS
jgi:uncharacterized membrane protein (GlpM family)